MFADTLLDIDRYENWGVIGRGQSGTVVERYHSLEDRLFAVKFIDVPERLSEREAVQKEFLREVEALLRLKHPCIISYCGCFLPRARDLQPRLGIALDFKRTSLDKVIHGTHPQPWWNATAKSIVVAGLALSLRHVHGRGFIHRDLKPSNVLLDDDHRPCLADFGITVRTSVAITGVVGTLQYMAPEQTEEGYTNKVDVWAFGTIIWEIFSGEVPFSGLEPGKILRRVCEGERQPIPE